MSIFTPNGASFSVSPVWANHLVWFLENPDVSIYSFPSSSDPVQRGIQMRRRTMRADDIVVEYAPPLTGTPRPSYGKFQILPKDAVAPLAKALRESLAVIRTETDKTHDAYDDARRFRGEYHFRPVA